MGVSTDGKLVYGFEVGEDESTPDWMGEHTDFDDWLLEKLGISEDAPYKERQAAIEACPAELFWHCSYEYPMYILGPRGCDYRASRGYAQEIKVADLTVDPAKIAAFKAWCEENGIEYQEPAWLLCSMWG